jgi:hypothetical protein
MFELIVSFPRFNFEFAIRFHDPPSGHCDLGNNAGLPMLAGNPRSFRLLGLPRTPQQKRGFVRQAVQNIENTTSRIFLCKESQERKKHPIKNGVQPAVRIPF